MSKNPKIAAILSIIPGLGHIYINKKLRAFEFFIGTLILFFLSFSFATITMLGVSFFTIMRAIITIIFVCSGLFVWVWSGHNAYHWTRKYEKG